MPLLSSPLIYPPTSSPTLESPRKRRKIESRRSPLQDLAVNVGATVVGGFLIDELSEEESDVDWRYASKAEDAGSLQNLEDALGDIENLRRDDSPCTARRRRKASEDAIFTFAEKNPPLLESCVATQSASIPVKAFSGRVFSIKPKAKVPPIRYEQLIAARSATAPGRAKKSYYGIDIHQLKDDAEDEAALSRQDVRHTATKVTQATVERSAHSNESMPRRRTLMWTEKYRARKFTDLLGDERTHRSVLRWLKRWDSVVFPGANRQRSKAAKAPDNASEENYHRKILLLTGPPGLGKTTLAHVCARQAGYEVQEINASDDRSREVVNGRIRDMLGTENVKIVDSKASSRRVARPVCIVVDEVDGVVSGSGAGGEGGFVKALIDLVHLDQKNSNGSGKESAANGHRKKRKGEHFRMLRPLILICNDVYHPSLRLLRQSTIAEIVHVRSPALNMVIPRMQSIFEREDVPSDTDGVRRLCEAVWGLGSHKEGRQGRGTGEGDIRGIMVVAESVASRIRTVGGSTLALSQPCRLTRKWVEEHLLSDFAHGGGAARSLGRGGAKEIVDRVFLEDVGFPKAAATVQPSEATSRGLNLVGGVAEASKKRASDRLREMVDSSGDSDRIISDCFTIYPSQPFQDDTFLSKPGAISSHLHFHDRLSKLVHQQQEWELAPYLSQSVLAFHHLFAGPASARATWSTSGAGSSKWAINKDDGDAGEGEEPLPFSGPRADFEAREALTANTAHLQAWQSQLSLPLQRQFRSLCDLATDLLPYVLRMTSPDVKPVVVGGAASSTASVRKGSEKDMVKMGANALLATGISLDKIRIEAEAGSGGFGGFVYRMEPPLDEIGMYLTKGKRMGEGEGKVRFAVRQVLDAGLKMEMLKRAEESRRARWAGNGSGKDAEFEKMLVSGARDEKAKGVVQDSGKARAKNGVKRDFFGRVISDACLGSASGESAGVGDRAVHRGKAVGGNRDKDGRRVWVTFHEGYSNAVRKPITTEELLRGL